MFTKAFWAASTERALKTLAQAALSVLIVNGVAVGFNDIDWLKDA